MRRVLLGFLVCVVTANVTRADDTELRRDATAASHKALAFFTSQVATEGGYLWQYSEDLARREGEGRASDTMVWVQPPGTPAVGMALLDVYHATGGARFLEAAKNAGRCLVRGQLRSGGWDYRIEFNPDQRGRYAYRVDEPVAGRSQRNTSTLDDNTTQAALRLLMRLDKTLDMKDEKIHEAAQFALARLLAVQYPIGAWPQRFERPADPDKFPIRKAAYPDSWSRTHPSASYSQCYTFNDNAIGDVIDVMFEAAKTYNDPKYAQAAEKAGQFILLAQMPEPQPAWAQQYNAQMQPVWARRFEPPSVTGGESQGVMRTLMQLYRETGDKKFLEPIPKAIAYFRRSQRPDGQLARFYELKTNRPLYFTIDYKLTYSDADMPTHYAFVIGNGIDAIERQYQHLLQLALEQLLPPPPSPPRNASNALRTQVQTIIDSLDDQGRWVDDGPLRYHGADDPTRRVISCAKFITNIRTLGQYLATRADRK